MEQGIPSLSTKVRTFSNVEFIKVVKEISTKKGSAFWIHFNYF